MRFLPSGSTALLVELTNLDDVLELHAALVCTPPAGVVDIVPAARTVLLIIDPARTTLAAVQAAVRRATPRPDRRTRGELVDIPVSYDGADLEEVAALLNCAAAEVIRRHTTDDWVVAFCGFAPGFAYLTSTSPHSSSWRWDVPRQTTPRTRVPAGAVALAGEFTGVYPRESPGGWQLLGSTDLAVFDVNRKPAALLRPGTRARFIDQGR